MILAPVKELSGEKFDETKGLVAGAGGKRSKELSADEYF